MKKADIVLADTLQHLQYYQEGNQGKSRQNYTFFL